MRKHRGSISCFSFGLYCTVSRRFSTVALKYFGAKTLIVNNIAGTLSTLQVTRALFRSYHLFAGLHHTTGKTLHTEYPICEAFVKNVELKES